MNFSLQDLTVIIIAENWNPAMFNLHWLIKNGIFSDDEEVQTNISSPQVSNFKNNEFSLLVLPKQIQFSINPDLQPEAYPYEKLIEMLNKIGYAPVSAMGVNFKWKQDTGGEAISKFTRDNYCFTDKSIFRAFADPSSKFGLYLSKDVYTSRLKLNILPIREKSGEEYVQYSFNFHHDLDPENDYERMIDIIRNWKGYYDEALKIIESFKN